MTPLEEELPVTKKCSTCKKIKSIDNFSRNICYKDGHAYQCRECKNKANVNWKAKNRDKVLAEKKRSNDFRVKTGKREADLAMLYAIRKKIIKSKPCAVCGKKAQAHHMFGYDRPLEVVWLCALHHKWQHMYMSDLIYKAVTKELDDIQDINDFEVIARID